MCYSYGAEPIELDLLDWSNRPLLHAVACDCYAGEATVQRRIPSIDRVFSFHFSLQLVVDCVPKFSQGNQEEHRSGK